MNLRVFRSKDGRFRTDFYIVNGEQEYALAEKIAKGVLLTRFTQKGEVLDQLSQQKEDTLAVLKAYLPTFEMQFEEVNTYTPVAVQAKCIHCKEATLKRELELLNPRNIVHVPVVPLFVCTRCTKKFYSMTQTYLSSLVAQSTDLFEKNELEEKEKNSSAFIKELDEYIIRIFASKRITRMTIEK